ncbi:MAG: ExbD/TolR family protein, partial [Candidatus Zixiibacteriota bacterium]
TTFKPPETKAVTLPQSHSEIKLPEKDIINITVTKLDSIFVDYLEPKTVEIDGVEMTSMVRRYAETDAASVSFYINQARARNFRALVVIKADQNAAYGVMQQVMESMQQNNLTKFQVVTDMKIEEKE